MFFAVKGETMASRVISIEMGFAITKVCEMDFKSSSPKIYSSFAMETPEGVLSEDGYVVAKEEFVEKLLEEMREQGMKSKQVVFSIFSPKIASREVQLPYVKENKIGMMIQANAGDYFPIELVGYELAHIVLGTEEVDSSKHYRLMVLAVPQDLVGSYYDLADQLHLEVAAIDYAANSVYNAIRKDVLEKTEMYIKVEERSTLILIMKQGNMLLSRNIPYGIDHAVTEIMENRVFGEQLTFQHALELSRRKTCIHISMDSENKEIDEFSEHSIEEISQARRDVTNALVALVGGIARVVDYWNSRNQDALIQKAYLTGLGADFSGLSKLLSSEITTKVKVLKEIKGVTFDKSLNDVSLGEYITCIGAAMNPVGISLKREGKKEVSQGGSRVVLGVVVCVAGLVVAGSLAAISILPYQIQKGLNDDYKNRIHAMKPAYDTYAEYIQSLYDYDKMTTLHQSTLSRMDDLKAFIEEMEVKMPDSFRVSNFVADDIGIAMDVTVDSKEAVAETISQFRTFESVQYVDADSITVTSNEGGDDLHTFSVRIEYKDLGTVDQTAEETSKE